MDSVPTSSAEFERTASSFSPNFRPLDSDCGRNLEPKTPYWPLRLLAFSLAPLYFMGFGHEGRPAFHAASVSIPAIAGHLLWRVKKLSRAAQSRWLDLYVFLLAFWPSGGSTQTDSVSFGAATRTLVCFESQCADCLENEFATKGHFRRDSFAEWT